MHSFSGRSNAIITESFKKEICRWYENGRSHCGIGWEKIKAKEPNPIEVIDMPGHKLDSLVIGMELKFEFLQEFN